jgi:hypothetical protein
LLLVILEALFEVISLLTIYLDLSIHLLLRFLLFCFNKFLLFWFSLLFEKVVTIFRFNQVWIQLLVFVFETLNIHYFHKFFWNEFPFCKDSEIIIFQNREYVKYLLYLFLLLFWIGHYYNHSNQIKEPFIFHLNSFGPPISLKVFKLL